MPWRIGLNLSNLVEEPIPPLAPELAMFNPSAEKPDSDGSDFALVQQAKNGDREPDRA